MLPEMNYSNYTELVFVKNDSVIGNFEATFAICNSGKKSAYPMFFYSDAHIYLYLTLYKQGKTKFKF